MWIGAKPAGFESRGIAYFWYSKNFVRSSANSRRTSIMWRSHHGGKIRLTIGLPSIVTVEPSSEAGFDLDGGPKFNVTIIYEDSAAGRRAKHFYDKVIWELLSECDFNLELWSFQVLGIRQIGKSAARAAAQADLVILSMHGNTELPTQARNWIERWSRLVVDNKPALVVLLDQTQAKSAKVDSTLRYLGNVAHRNGISFYPHTTSCVFEN